MPAWLRRLDSFWYAPLPALRLAYLRLLVGAYSLIYLAVWAPNFLNVSGYAPERFSPVGPVSLLVSPLPPIQATLIFGLTLLTGLAFSLGWHYRWLGPIYAVLLLWTTSYRSSWGMIFHTENLMTLHVMLLSVAPAADTFSLDRKALRATSDNPANPHGRYGWCIRAMCTVTVAAYLLAGVAKLRVSGWAWASGEVLQNQVAFDNLRKLEFGSWHSPLGVWAAPHRSIFGPLAALSLLLEVGAPVALLSRKLARIWALGVWAFHWGILLMMAIAFAYPLSGIAFFSFLAPEGWKRLRFLQRCFEPKPNSAPG